MYDETVVPMLSVLLERNYCAGIGEFHDFGTDIDHPVLQQVITHAERHRIFLRAHSDADVIERLFASNPGALVNGAHSGFGSPAEKAPPLEKHPNLWSDLEFRSERVWK